MYVIKIFFKFEEINEKFKTEVKKSEEDLSEMRFQIENHMNKEWCN